MANDKLNPENKNNPPSQRFFLVSAIFLLATLILSTLFVIAILILRPIDNSVKAQVVPLTTTPKPFENDSTPEEASTTARPNGSPTPSATPAMEPVIGARRIIIYDSSRGGAHRVIGYVNRQIGSGRIVVYEKTPSNPTPTAAATTRSPGRIIQYGGSN